jgi:hypothetical protein
LVFFDITSESSFANVEGWLREIKNNSTENVKVVLVGTKCDLEKRRKISKEEATEYAIKNNLQYFETSSKSNVNVNETVEFLSLKMMCLVYPQLEDYLSLQTEWKPETHTKFPLKFKKSIFCFLMSLKRYEKLYKIKVPKVIRFEIIKTSNPDIDLVELVREMKPIPIESITSSSSYSNSSPQNNNSQSSCLIF